MTDYRKALGLVGDGEIRMRIKRQKQLLRERCEEYKVFGRTGADAYYDNQIREEIRELTSQLSRPIGGKNES